MAPYYDEVEIEDMQWDEEKRVFHYPCPCGDRFEISRKQLANYEDVATCPSCSLIIRVVYDPLDFEDEPPDEEDDPADGEEDEEKDEEDEDSEGDDEFVDAMEKLQVTEATAAPLVAAAA